MKLMYRYILCLIFVVLLFSCYSSSKINVKLLKVSESFLGFPYKLNPLGENSGIDKDPIYRFDSFDCMTYVETVLALSFSKNKNDFIEVINNIRYKNGNVSFINRLHFQNPDWINNNKNYVQNISNIISKKLLNKNAYISNILLDRQEWFKKNYNIDIKINKEIVNVDYISFKDLYNNIKSFSNYITKPHIFMTVISDLNQKEKIGTQVDISHTGFIINKNGNLYIRHASSKYKKVIDESFDKYIEKFLNNQKYKGFVILEIKF